MATQSFFAFAPPPPPEATPIIKWAGGKSRLLGELLPLVPKQLRVYAEPFAGGAALFFAVVATVLRGERSVETLVLADRNAELVALYRAVAFDVEGVIAALAGYRNERSVFDEVRALDTSAMSDIARGARFLFLNRTCFNGLWRVNRKGHFNVPFGGYPNPRIVDPEGLRAASAVLARADVHILDADFAEVTRELGEGDFAFLDPPYDPLSPTASFSGYAADGFGVAGQERVAAEMHALRGRGARGVMTNHDTPRVRSLCDGLHIRGVEAPRSIAANGSRATASEVIVTTWEAT